MNLGTVVKSTQDESFEQLNSDGTFSYWAEGRLAPVDRFLSNFHKPLQRRMLFTDPTTPYPDSYVIKETATEEIYIVGQSRKDAQDNESYDRLSVIHSVDSESSGVVEYFNFNTIDPDTALADETGKTSEGNFYVSVEYVSTKSSEYGDEAYQGKLIAYAPLNLPFKRDGVFTLNGKSYKVIQSYIDSGFSCAVLFEQEDDMVQITHKVINYLTSGYDPVTGDIARDYIEKKYSGSVDQVKESGNVKTYNVYIKNSQLDSNIKSGEILEIGGKELYVSDVNSDKNSQGQIQIICQGTL